MMTSRSRRAITPFDSQLGYAEHNDTFTAEAGGEVEAEIDLIPVAGIVTINANTKGATVKVDGKVVGGFPSSIRRSSLGRCMSVEAPGAGTLHARTDIVAGQPFPLDVEMTKILG